MSSERHMIVQLPRTEELMSGRSDRCFGTPTGATTLLLFGQAHSDLFFGTPAGATALLLRGQARSNQCFGTPAGATALLLSGQARISSVLYHTFRLLVYCVHLILGPRSR